MARGRPLEDKQTNRTVVLVVRNYLTWDSAREFAKTHNMRLSDLVEAAVTEYVINRSLAERNQG